MTRFLVMSPAPRHLSVWTARRVLLHMVHPTWASCCTCLGGPGALYGQWKHWNLSASGGAQPRDFMAEGQRGSSSAAPACCGNTGPGLSPSRAVPALLLLARLLAVRGEFPSLRLHPAQFYSESCCHKQTLIQAFSLKGQCQLLQLILYFLQWSLKNTVWGIIEN